MKEYYTYIASNKANAVLYTGITNNIERRIFEHQNKLMPGFTSKYNVTKLIWFESFNSPEEAIAAEKKIKGWTREKKLNLIKSFNPNLNDLFL